MLTWNLGAGPRRIFTQKPIEMAAALTPIDIRVGRVGREAWLSVDGRMNVSGHAAGSLTRMDVLPVLYMGGHEVANFSTLPHDLPLHSGFQGCIYDVHLKAGQVLVPLQESRGVRGRSVGQCGTKECHRHACQNDGACLHHGATFSCICQDGWYGPLCSQKSNPCDSGKNDCAAGSRCVPLVNGYECDCPLGLIGRYCEQQIQSLSDVSMSGRRSFLSLRPPIRSKPVVNEQRVQVGDRLIMYNSSQFLQPMSNNSVRQNPMLMVAAPATGHHHRVQHFSVEFQIRPLSERGLLLYYGAFDDNLDRSLGFLSVSLQGGVVEFRLSSPSSSHVHVVRSARMLAIGEWHRIKVIQSGRRLTLWVEGTASASLASSAEVLIREGTLLYVGGLPDLSRLPFNAVSGFPGAFRGCVRQMMVNGVRVVLNETSILGKTTYSLLFIIEQQLRCVFFSTESQNINDCDGTPCGGDSCESNGQCWLDDIQRPHCKCPENVHGERCEFKESCRRVMCKNGGKCPRGLTGRCNCPNGWGGYFCEIGK